MTEALALLPGLQPVTLLLAMGVAFLAAALSGLSGFGAGLIVTVFITPVVGAKAVIPLLSVLMLFTNASRVWFFRAGLEWRLLLLVSATAVPASVLGALVYVRLEAALIEALLGVVLILAVPLRRRLAGRRALVPGRAAALGFGAGFGFLSSLLVGAGMLMIPFLLGAGLAGPALLATDAAVAVLLNLAKIAAFGSLAALDLPLLLLASLMGLCAIPGTWVAAWILRRTSLRLHTLFMEALVVLGGASMLWRAFAGG